MVTVNELLNIMDLALYTHVLLRHKLPLQHGFDYVGGGLVDEVCKKYGEMVVQRCVIWDNKLLIYVY